VAHLLLGAGRRDEALGLIGDPVPDKAGLDLQ
jgi:hypothetical protein